MTNAAAQQPFPAGLLLALLVLVVIIVFVAVRYARRATERQELVSAHDPNNGLPGPWLVLHNEVEAANRTLNRQVFERVRQLFLDYYKDGKTTPGALTREYEKDEFLVVVDADGRPSMPVMDMLDRYYSVAETQPAFAHWFKEGTLKEGKYAGMPVLMAARWLCHLVGLRHVTVEIFIDPPEGQVHASQAAETGDRQLSTAAGLSRSKSGFTLVQVRGMDRFEAPGRFDIPCAGHVSETDTNEEALRKELGEELNLDVNDLGHVRLLESYNSFSEAPNGMSFNYEYRLLYRARLKREATERIQFSDGEVAGLSVFSVAELRELIRRYPERVASGLSDAIGYYE